MNRKLITVHCLVRNEDKFVWFALNSVLPFVDRVLVYDTGSTDNTVAVIQTIQSAKIFFAEKGAVTPQGHTRLRREMIAKTKTPFFLLVDGDEVWPKRSLVKLLETIETLPEEKLGIVTRTRNCAGDAFHYLPEETGKYELAGQKGHLALHLYRKVPGISIEGDYPLEHVTYQGSILNTQEGKLLFLPVWYLHATHLSRSTSTGEVLGRRRMKTEAGISMERSELPAVFFQKRPAIVPDPLGRRSARWEILARILSPLRKIKRYAKI